jgi:hypothetical protein
MSEASFEQIQEELNSEEDQRTLHQILNQENEDIINSLIKGTVNAPGLNLNNDTDRRIALANEIVRRAMLDTDFNRHLRDKHAEFLHSFGWSVGKNFKAAAEIPEDAYAILPYEIKEDAKELMKWVKMYHPYLIFTGYTSIKQTGRKK